LEKILKRLLVIKIAVKRPMKFPKTKVKAKPLTKLIPKLNKTRPTKMVEEFPSRIDGQARLKPSSREIKKFLPCLASSLILVKIKILASTLPAEVF